MGYVGTTERKKEVILFTSLPYGHLSSLRREKQSISLSLIGRDVRN
jgi:hypothetical protein